MKRRLLPSFSPAALLGLWLVATGLQAALVPTEWRHRQDLAVAAPGLVQVILPDATFDAAQPDLADLRVLDANGRETALLLDVPPAPVAHAARPAAFTAKLIDGVTVLTLTTGTTEPLAAVTLETPHPRFLRAAKLETSGDGSTWTLLDEGVPLFRQWGAEKLELSLDHRPAAYVRISVGGDPLPFTGATLALAAGTSADPVPVGASITAREEFAGETVLTLILAGRHAPLAALTLETPEPLFMRRVTVTVRDVRNLGAGEQLIGSGSLYRLAVDGAPVRSSLELKLNHVPLTREILVHIHHGDSPPLAVTEVRCQRRPVSLWFMASTAGQHTLLTGNPQATNPHYDLAGFAGEMRTAAHGRVTPGPLQDNPGYQPRTALPDPTMSEVPLAGAPLDKAAWTRQKPLQLAAPGVQELELDVTTLAGSRSDLADLRLMRTSNQIPYLIERPGLARAITLVPVAVPDAKQPTVSRWQIKLPQAGLPLLRLALTANTALFQRQFRLFEKVAATDGQTYEHTLAAGGWSRTLEPGSSHPRVFELGERPQTDTLYLETDNGDNPAILIGSVKAEYPVVRLIFVGGETDGYQLAYGNPQAAAPQYDLSLVARKLLTSGRTPARLGEETVQAQGGAWRTLQGGPIFWAALGLVVVVLLVVVARLLPKPDAGN